MQNAAIQYKRKYDWLKQYQFQKGQSGNPTGINVSAGKTAKAFAREMLLKMTDEARAEFLEKLDPEIVWRMAEGNPHNTDTVVTMSISDVLKELNENVRIERQNLENEPLIQDSGQTEAIDILPEKQSSEPLRQQQMVEKYHSEV